MSSKKSLTQIILEEMVSFCCFEITHVILQMFLYASHSLMVLMERVDTRLSENILSAMNLFLTVYCVVKVI